MSSLAFAGSGFSTTRKGPLMARTYMLRLPYVLFYYPFPPEARLIRLLNPNHVAFLG
jgi:hypothetical protein